MKALQDYNKNRMAESRHTWKPALRRLRQEGCCNFEACLVGGYRPPPPQTKRNGLGELSSLSALPVFSRVSMSDPALCTGSVAWGLRFGHVPRPQVHWQHASPDA